MSKRIAEKISVLLFVFGMGTLLFFFEDMFWPWFMVILGVSQLPLMIASKSTLRGFQFAVIFCGIAISSHYDQLVAGVFFSIGVVLLLDLLFKGKDSGQHRHHHHSHNSKHHREKAEKAKSSVRPSRKSINGQDYMEF